MLKTGFNRHIAIRRSSEFFIDLKIKSGMSGVLKNCNAIKINWILDPILEYRY